MIKVALTGNIASGKSTVARAWRALGARVIEADELARRAVAPGTPALARIVARWGPGVLLPNGELDRAALRDLVFRDRAEREQLEAIVHPEVERLRQEAFAAAETDGLRIVAADIPLLFEVGLQHDFDAVVLVDAPEAVRLERLVENRNLSPQEAERMIASQLPAEAKRPQAHYVLDNTGSVEELKARAGAVWREIEAGGPSQRRAE